MINVKEYRQMKSELDTLNKEAVRCEVELDAVMERMKKEFGCDTVEEARDRLNKLENDIAATVKEFNKAFDAFRRKWRDKFKFDPPTTVGKDPC